MKRWWWFTRGLGAPRLAVMGGLSLVGATACSSFGPGSEPVGPVTVPAAQVQQRDLQQTLSYSGNVQAPQQITVLPKASGRVEQVLVDVGSSVHAGDLLIQLEQDAPAIQVLQARASLAAAQAKLAQIQGGGRAEEIAAAQDAVAQQQARLGSMQAGGRAEDVAGAQAALEAQQAKLDLMRGGGRQEVVSQAAAGLDAAQQKLALVEQGATDDVRQAVTSAVESDQAAVLAAQAAVQSLGGTTAADVQAAHGQVDTLTAQVSSAQGAVAAADAALRSVGGVTNADLLAAQSAYEAAVAQRDAISALIAQANQPLTAQLDQAKTARAQAGVAQTTARATFAALVNGEPPLTMGTACLLVKGTRVDDSVCSTQIQAADQGVTAADLAAQTAQDQLDLLQAGGPGATLKQLQAQLTAAEGQARTAQAKLDALKNGGVDAQRAQVQSQRGSAQAQLTSAQEALKVANARLSALTSGAIEAQRQAAQAQLVAAQQRLKSDQAKLDQLDSGARPEEIQAAQDAVIQAERQLAVATQPATDQEIRGQSALVEQARQMLEKAKRPFTDFDLQQQQAVVDQAQHALNLRTYPFTDQDRSAAQAAVDQAQAQLELAQLAVKETRIVAAVDGVVLERLTAPGALVGPMAPVLILVPPALDVVVNVEEASLGQIAVGQKVSLEVPAYPGKVFEGAVTAIAPAVDPRTRTAAVHVRPVDTSGGLRSGMMAQVSIATASRKDVLVIPRKALVGAVAPNAAASVLTIDATNHVRKTAVQLGLIADGLVEIRSGLEAGQLVATGNLGGLNGGDVVSPSVDGGVAQAR